MDITVSLVSSLIAKQFPQWTHLPIKPVELSGWDNRTFRLGDDMTVRLPSLEMYEAQVKKEQQWLPRLAPRLPVAIPTPVAMGTPSAEYPLHWSIYRWIDGDIATTERISNLNDFAIELAQFLNALQQIDANDGPPFGAHNFNRGGSLGKFNDATQNAITGLTGMIDTIGATTVWDSAIQTIWDEPPVWVHGDIYPTNLLVKGGHLSAVIDFGCSGVGDPACDLTIAWTFFSGKSRQIFRSHLQLDDATWERARGWALWYALMVVAYPSKYPSHRLEESHRVIKEVIDEHKSR